MKKLIYIIMCTAVLFLSQSCSKEAPFTGEEDTMGQLLTSSVSLEFINEELQSRAGTDVNLADFTVSFRKNAENVAYVEYKYSEMPEVVSLPAGTYRVEAYYGSEVDAEWESPYYKGIADPVTVTAKKIATLEKPIKCKLNNIKVTVEYNDDLLKLMADDASVNVKVGAAANLTFAKNENRSGYFMAANTMIAEFAGKVNGQEASSRKQYNEVKAGTHYHILFVYKAAEIVGDGTIDPVGGINVSAQVTVTDVNDGTNLDAGGDDEYLEDDRNKGGEDDDPSKPDDPTPPAEGGPNITAEDPIMLSNGNADGNLLPVIVENGMVCEVKIESVTGITSFTADIVSPVLTEELLVDLGLSTHLDLCNPGECIDGLHNIGLLEGESVKGKTAVDFKLTDFLVPLAAIGAGSQHSFVLTVGDDSGVTVKTLTLKCE